MNRSTEAFVEPQPVESGGVDFALSERRLEIVVMLHVPSVIRAVQRVTILPAAEERSQTEPLGNGVDGLEERRQGTVDLEPTIDIGIHQVEREASEITEDSPGKLAILDGESELPR